MKRFGLIVLAACVAHVSAIAFLLSVIPAQAKQCSVEQPSNARSYWYYRIINGRKCWYEGQPMLAKSLLEWRKNVSTKSAIKVEENVVTEKRGNPLDAQAWAPKDPDTFEARWRARIPEL